jgi:hypothetical protein
MRAQSGHLLRRPISNLWRVGSGVSAAPHRQRTSVRRHRRHDLTNRARAKPDVASLVVLLVIPAESIETGRTRLVHREQFDLIDVEPRDPPDGVEKLDGHSPHQFIHLSVLQ